ncbi:YheT family hydrolase [Acinetobacter sp.]|uniref:YheT family hydrolase n=1 Tax=Acinetobacter sp. TaxID=472 RepID=UPI00264A308F|nr:alpha/beta fold hydrolase [Acinetobacter sp.]MDN5512869.1 alpha/beta hydrolase [Acinetobacter sp.]MDN5525519.1 alpha/beta hydrolase [Acinetobacter sp.]
MKFMPNKISQFVQDIVDQVTGAELPILYGDPQGEVRQKLDALPQLQQKYRPTPWLANTHVHLLYFDLIKKKNIQLHYDAIEQLQMPDGGVTAIAWYGLHLPADTPTIVLMHTLTGTPESMAELVGDLHRHTGWRIALCLRRGHANLPMPVPKISMFGSTDDLREQIQYIQTRFPQSALYAVGSSAGTGLLVRYLGEEGENTPFKAAFALCPGYDTELGFKNVHPFYSRLMTKKLFDAFIHPYSEAWQQIPSLPKVLAAKDLLEFQYHYFELAGYSSFEDYNQATNPIHVFENVKIPLMILNAEDDPVCHIRNLEPYKEAIQKMPNIVVVTTKKGSHCIFYEGVKQPESWATRLIADYLLVYQ